jgi:hypothetical protein
MIAGPSASLVRGLFRRGRILPVAALFIVAGLGLAACSSGKSGSGNTTTSSSSSTGSPAGTGNSGSTTSPTVGGSSELGVLSGELQSAKQLTFSATYAESGSGTTANSTLTYAQMPPKSLFKAASAVVIDTGTGTYSCSSSAGTPICVSFGSSDPLASALNFVTGGTELTAINALKSGIAQKLPNFSASYSTATYAGQQARCISGTESSNTFKYCLTSQGVLAYAGGSSTHSFGSLSLSSFTTNVSSSEFALPAGATVETIPDTSSSY